MVAGLNSTTRVGGLRRKVGRIERRADYARRVLVMSMAKQFVADVVHDGPRDTNRYVKAWAQAGTMAGVGAPPTPPLQASKFRKKILRRVNRQLRQWEAIVKRYEDQGRVDKWYRQAVRTRDKARDEVAKAQRGEFSIAFGLFGRQGATRRLDITVRDKVYGGAGRIVALGGRTFAVLHNKEAHASVVEYHHGTVRKALARLRPFGGRRQFIKRQYVRELLGR